MIELNLGVICLHCFCQNELNLLNGRLHWEVESPKFSLLIYIRDPLLVSLNLDIKLAFRRKEVVVVV